MKRLIFIFFVGLTTAATVFAFQPIEQGLLSQTQLARIEKQLAANLQSAVARQQVDAALVLHRMIEIAPGHEWNRCVIPLMQILNRETNESASRVLAAMVLHELRSERGDFAISRNAQFTDDQRVKRYCTILTRTRLLEKIKS